MQRYRIKEFARILFLLVAVVVLARSKACAQPNSGRTSKRPESLMQTLGWMPEQTDTIMAARSFQVPWGLHGSKDFEATSNLSEVVEFVLQYFTVHPHLDPESGRVSYLKSVAGQPLRYAVVGATNYSTVSPFGSFRYQGCHVLVFENELGAARQQLEQLLQDDAASVETMVGHKVYVLDRKFATEPYIASQEWEGLFFVQPEPRTLIYATHQEYLRELLQNRQADRGERAALPEQLAVWQHVDPAATAWAVRHFSNSVTGTRRQRQRVSSGFALTLHPDGTEVLRIVYLPVDRARPEKLVRQRWLDSPLLRHKPDINVELQRGDSNSMVATIHLTDREDNTFITRFTMLLHLAKFMSDELVLWEQ